MKHIHVTCAIIEQNGLVLAARRSSSMNLPLKWEFPGGKIRAGEDPGDCLKREIMEELDLEVDIADQLSPSTHTYPDFIVTLYPFICKAETSRYNLAEHAEAVWLSPDELFSLDWAEADLPVLDAYLGWLERRS
jgi:8-oxo-dGTP diphosphatase